MHPGKLRRDVWRESARFHLCLRQGRFAPTGSRPERRAGRLFAWLEVGSVKVSLSRTAPAPVTPTVGPISLFRIAHATKREPKVDMNEEIKAALKNDRTIDIITIGAKSGLPRKIEIWFTNVNGRIIICGTPNAAGDKGPYSRRDWLANLRANPEFTFCLKESLKVELPATAMEIVDPQDRRYLMSAPETKWYRNQVDSVEDLVKESPIVEVFFRDHA